MKIPNDRQKSSKSEAGYDPRADQVDSESDPRCGVRDPRRGRPADDRRRSRSRAGLSRDRVPILPHPGASQRRASRPQPHDRGAQRARRADGEQESSRTGARTPGRLQPNRPAGRGADARNLSEYARRLVAGHPRREVLATPRWTADAILSAGLPPVADRPVTIPRLQNSPEPGRVRRDERTSSPL